MFPNVWRISSEGRPTKLSLDDRIFQHQPVPRAGVVGIGGLSK